MLQLKKLTRKEKELLCKHKLKPENWLVERRPPGELHLVHRLTDRKRMIKTA